MKHHAACAVIVGAGVLLGISGCTTADGEGPRYTARVESVSKTQVCVGPNESQSTVTCGAVPAGFRNPLPRVGQCVSLFAHFKDQGRSKTWTGTSVRLSVADTDCKS